MSHAEREKAKRENAKREARFIEALIKVGKEEGLSEAGMAAVYGNANLECGSKWDEKKRPQIGRGPGVGPFQFEEKHQINFQYH